MNMISIKLIFIKVLSRVHNYLNKSINYRQLNVKNIHLILIKYNKQLNNLNID